MGCRTERLAISGAKPVSRRLCRTIHGPVQARAGRTVFSRRYAIWGRELRTFEGIEQLNRAGSLREAERAVAELTWNENTLVADSQATIGWWHPGLLPLKPRRWDERLPFRERVKPSGAAFCGSPRFLTRRSARRTAADRW